MSDSKEIGALAINRKGWLRSHQWLLWRRAVQVMILALFLAGPLAGVWLLKGSLAGSRFLDLVPLHDPYIQLQGLVGGHIPTTTVLIGVLLVGGFYLLVGGRVYCSWVCPVNMITDAAAWLRRRLGIEESVRLARATRYWLMGMVLLLSALLGMIVWELLNPITMLYRGLLFGMGLAWLIPVAIFFFDLLVAKHGWCGHLCPVGSFYSLLAVVSPLRVRANGRQDCIQCLDCYAVCPEPQVISPALNGEEQGRGPVIVSANCTNCGRCIDICAEGVFSFGSRFHNQ